jgi:glutathione S-transferase
MFGTSSSIYPNEVRALGMVRTRGLEIRTEGATPAAGEMTLYIKAGPDGKSVGDCPFAHYAQMVLHEKGLPFTVIPSIQETKPDWLIDFYGGSMPALRHRKECYVDSDVIAQYLDFFFIEPKLSEYSKAVMSEASDSTDGFFPALAKYLKSTTDGDEADLELKESLKQALSKIEEQLNHDGKTGPYLAGDGEDLTLLDCALAPKLYHMSVGLKEFKSSEIDVGSEFPLVKNYMDAVFDRESFKNSIYPEETIVWGWSNARNSN